MTILLVAVILLGVTAIGAAAGIMLTEGMGGNEPVISLFSEEVVSPIKEDNAPENETDAPASVCNEVSVDAITDNNIPDPSSAAPSGLDSTPDLPGRLTDEQLQEISAVLGVPEDLDTRIIFCYFLIPLGQIALMAYTIA